MLKALRNRPIALLWLGQSLSAIGDEIYRVALIWLAVDLIGADTGYLAAAQCAALLSMSVVGGGWADRWDHFRTLIWVDGIRALIVLSPFVLSHFTPVTLPMLWAMALLLSALGAFFDPALQAMLPRFSPDLETLRAATGLMSTTLRLARVVGPLVIGLLTPFIATIHFFPLDAITFAVSALSINSLRRIVRKRGEVKIPPPARMSFMESLSVGFSAIREDEVLRYVYFVRGVVGGAWSLAYGLGLVLLVHKIAPHDVRAFGMVVASYGIGNVGAALVVGNLRRRRPLTIMFGGYIWMGMGFLMVAASPNFTCILIAAAATAIGGPVNDIPFVDYVQARFSIMELPKVFRLRVAVETLATLICMLASPFLFKHFSISGVIACCGLTIFAAGGLGWISFSERRIVGGDSTQIGTMAGS